MEERRSLYPEGKEICFLVWWMKMALEVTDSDFEKEVFLLLNSQNHEVIWNLLKNIFYPRGFKIIFHKHVI